MGFDSAGVAICPSPSPYVRPYIVLVRRLFFPIG